MHPNAFGGRAPHGPFGGAYSAPPDSVTELGVGWVRGVRRGRRRGKGEREGKERGGPQMFEVR